MRRTAYGQLLAWKNKNGRKPLVLQGARQVGKTWLMKEFGKNEYKQTVYLNFEDKKQLQSLFANDFDISRILLALHVETGVKANPEDTLIILDEIQEAERGVTALKYFYENAPEFHVMAAGSYLGISLQKKSSFPVGKVDFLHLQPLSYLEFLLASGEDMLVELLFSMKWELIKTFKEKYITTLRYYYFIGGMPEVVRDFVENQDFDSVRSLQGNILSAYQNDFAKHAPMELVPRINRVWNSIPAQLSRESRKFVFGLIKKGARAKEFELAIEWLIGSGLISKVFRVSKPGMPLKSYLDLSAFKVFFVDVGLLAALSGLDKKSIIEGNKIFEEFKGALTEQFVYQQILQSNLFYWSAESSSGEVDFIMQSDTKIIPIEVKAEENLMAKSLRFFHQKYNPEISVRTSMSDFRDDGWLLNVPLYAIGLLEHLLRK